MFEDWFSITDILQINMIPLQNRWKWLKNNELCDYNTRWLAKHRLNSFAVILYKKKDTHKIALSPNTHFNKMLLSIAGGVHDAIGIMERSARKLEYMNWQKLAKAAVDFRSLLQGANFYSNNMKKYLRKWSKLRISINDVILIVPFHHN